MENQVSPANPNQQPAYITPDVAQQQSPPQQNKLQEFFSRFSLRQIFNASSWTFLFLLAPFTVFVLISQNAVPGDAFYPLKRRLEDVVLVAAAAHPATRVAFRTNLTKRRFSEAETLLLARLDTEGLSNFVEEVQAARNEAEAISDPVKKEELVKELNNSLTEYAQRLTTVRQQVASQTKETIQSVPTQPPPQGVTPQPQQTTPVQQRTNTPTPVPLPPAGGEAPPPTSTPIPVTQPTLTPSPAEPSPTYALPSPTPTPQVLPPTPTDKIDQTIDYLTCLKTRRPSECTPPARTRSVHEEREERREAREERREEQREEKRDRKEEREERREKENRREKSP